MRRFLRVATMLASGAAGLGMVSASALPVGPISFGATAAPTQVQYGYGGGGYGDGYDEHRRDEWRRRRWMEERMRREGWRRERWHRERARRSRDWDD